MQKIAFIDRDGVINDDTGKYYIYKKEDFIITEGLIEALQLLENNDFKIIIITNQGGIAKKIYTKKEVDLLHSYLLDMLQKNDVNPLAIYYCPHHESVEQCLCKKPQSLMIEKALARFNGDIEKSFFIGDRESDLEAAKRAGIKGYKVVTNKGILPLAKQIVKHN